MLKSEQERKSCSRYEGIGAICETFETGHGSLQLALCTRKHLHGGVDEERCRDITFTADCSSETERTDKDRNKAVCLKKNERGTESRVSARTERERWV